MKANSTFKFLFNVGGVFFSYLWYAYFQEWTFRIPEIRNYSIFITMCEFALRSCLCTGQFRLGAKLKGTTAERKAPLKTYMLIGFLSSATMGLSNASLVYLNYPTQMIFKSCKLIPVMIGGILIQSKRYYCLDYISVSLMTVGLIWFTSIDRSLNAEFNITGIILISMALCVDAFLGNFQEKAMRDYRMGQAELMAYSYAFGTCLLVLTVLYDGSMTDAIAGVKKASPLSIYLILGLTICGFFGINFVMSLVKTQGALVSVTVTTLRKVFSTVISFIMFTKPFSIEYLLSGIVLLAGIILNVAVKNKIQCAVPNCSRVLLFILQNLEFLIRKSGCKKTAMKKDISMIA